MSIIKKGQKNMRLIDLRKAKGESQADIANILQITRQGYNNYENGNRQPDNETLRKLSSHFEVPIDYLLENDDLDKEDLGKALREEREYQSISLEELAKYIGISIESLEQYEEDEIPMSEFVIEKACEFFGLTYNEFLEKYNHYDEEIPEIFNGDVEKYEASKKAIEKDIKNEKPSSKELITMAAHNEGVELDPEDIEDILKQIQYRKWKKEQDKRGD